MSIFTKILLATDGSESSELAGLTALELSKRLDSEVHVIHVASEHPYLHAYYDLRHQEDAERFRDEDQRMLEEFVDQIRDAGGTIAESYLKVGDAAKEIVELAEELRVGLVLIGSRGHGRIRRALIGTVSTSVLSHAHCSVLIVRGHGPKKERVYLLGKILVAIDGSEEACAAAQTATEVAKAQAPRCTSSTLCRRSATGRTWDQRCGKAGKGASSTPSAPRARGWRSRHSVCGARVRRGWSHTSCWGHRTRRSCGWRRRSVRDS